jgi:Ca2+-transporting ATPase
MSTRTQDPTRADPATAWYRRDVDDVLDALGTSRDGLGDGEARDRVERHGPNRIQEQEQVSPWRVLLNQFTSPLIYVLLGALAVTLAIQSWADAIVIGIVLAVNGTIGFVQEYQAETAVQSLMEMVSPKAMVRRDGQTREIDAERLVPGDVVELSQGEVVPADVRLVEVRGLRVNEAALTGESVPADKGTDPLDEEHLPPADQRGMAFMSTAVTSGEGVGVVVATGAATEIGKIAEQVQAAGGGETPLQMRIDRLARWITIGILGVAVVAFGVGLLLGRDVVDMLLLAVALAVAAIPAGLPIVVTVALAIGVHRMAERHALIRNLHAVDTLGSCTTIISDKTGTLTQNRMAVRVVEAAGERYELPGDDERAGRGVRRDDEAVEVDDHPVLRQTLLVGLLCNDAELPDADADADDEDEDDATGAPPSGDPMEVALLGAARAAGLRREDEQQRHPRRDTVPFRTERRFMATVHDDGDDGDGPLVLVKGAPERVAGMCDRRLDHDGGEGELDRDEVVRRSEELAAEGLRVLAMAVGRGEDVAESVRGDHPGGLTFVGMQGLMDPPRPSAVQAVDDCHAAGIRVAMVTGDHAATAAAIGRQVHLDRPPAHRARRAGDEDRAAEVHRGQDLAELSDDELDRVIDDTNIYARVAPEQKLRLVDRLKARDEIVSVTGDGVNDAPALESAHLGAAMGSGTDVAKEASDMVITDDDFASVYAAVEEGRTAFRNIRMATFFLLSTGAADVLVILSALVLDWPLPLVPAQILWLNVVTNGIADVALAFEPGERSLFRRPPRPKSEGILDRVLLERLVVVGLWLAAGVVGMFWWQWSLQGEDLTAARTATLTTFVLFQMVHVFNCRSEDESVFSKSFFANRILLLGVLTSFAVHVGAMYFGPTQDLLSIEPMAPSTWMVAIAVASTAIVVNEAHKRLRPRQG